MTATDTATLIDGRALASKVKETLAARIEELRNEGRSVRLDVVLADENPAGSVYARNQAKMCEELGIEYRLHAVVSDAEFDVIASTIQRLNQDDRVTAIMVQLPLPDGVDTHRIQSLIAVEKDVEGVNPANIGGVLYGRRALAPCTALATMRLIESTGIELAGAEVVCVGASTIVGRPVAALLMEAEATVVSTNIHTHDLASHTRRADVVISAAGVPGLLTGEMIRPGAIIIDVGINRITDPETGKTRTVGDIDVESVLPVAGYLSPVPGGVGPMTVAMLLRNTVAAADEVPG
ncbi:MAG: bifunctional 5,10-methylenetetrahydrofolate dehydrogenase/5,10-methenyltetrahydrofolate cyclohydrolase [Phycisphaerales bacterium]|jgi:methylenetetrahydrofolate dehydrogenase (NADP+)/methenyltetrahydrofolate cyclohydrolase|nr:bifunctional 5,10-methylenetetrahydrofolate dehydrogenase/5,10-methenyltetrahydrofolate cyclohydrolase [Phycisphaerales bacterium]MDP6890462.1 bifunctional 5,10-methylenetetrahydrofolate dehydrogenase/5,10-methenyltetrahydrofolate cyclohydrolase [Phycisphaerales bacterium]